MKDGVLPGIILGVILARGGSKRLPRKNIRPLCGIPLIGWTIRAALGSAWLDRIVVSSDDDEILAVAMEYGAETVKRPAEMATDEAPSYPALFHAMELYNPSHIALLQPTSPLMLASDIDACIALAVDGGAAVSVHEGVANGAIYAADANWIRQAMTFEGVRVRHWMPAERSVDINTAEDFAIAEDYMRRVA